MKIVLFGNSGSGKSTLAQKLVAKFSLGHLDLDTVAWKKEEPMARRAIEDSSVDILQFIEKNQIWVIEGCYSSLLKIAMEHCSEIQFLNPGVDTCIENCKKRPWEPHKYKSSDEQNKNLDMLIGWVKEYESRQDEFSLAEHRALFNDYKGKKTESIEMAAF